MFGLFGGKKQKNTKPVTNSAASILVGGLTSIKDVVAPSFIEVDFNVTGEIATFHIWV